MGERDRIVPAKKSGALIEEILTKAGNKKVTVKTFGGADHFLHLSDSGGPRETFAQDRVIVNQKDLFCGLRTRFF